MLQQSSKLAQDRTASVVRVEPVTVDEPLVEAVRVRFQPIAVTAAHTTVSFTDQRLKFPRPPDLYLQHRAFLI